MIAGVIVPGARYPVQAPLLSLAAEALSDHNAQVETIEWLIPDGFFAADNTESFVRTYVAAALHRLGERVPGATPVVIAKSLGSYAAALVADRSLPAIWLTPVLTDDSIVAAITRSTAPALLIGGSADRMWPAGVAASTGKTVVTVEGGDHGLRVPGRLRAYTDVLGDIGTAVEDFLTGLP
jgi:hypothetical protein